MLVMMRVFRAGNRSRAVGNNLRITLSSKQPRKDSEDGVFFPVFWDVFKL
jgi:hypothetical protein